MKHIKYKTKLTIYAIVGIVIGAFLAWGLSVGAATVQNITGSDTVSDFPSVFNTTVNNLNADKLDTASSTDDLTEGNSNLYWTTARGTENFVSNLSATSSVDSITALDNLTTAGSLVTVGTLTTGSTGAGFTVNLDSSTLTCGSCIDISSHTNLIGGTNITLSGDTLNVDDAFLINSGDDITTGSITATEFIGNDANATSSFSGGLTVDQSVVVSGNFEANTVDAGNGTATTSIDGVGVTFPDGSVQSAAASGGGGAGTFGSGSDGEITISSNTTLTEDKQYETLTVNSGVTLDTNGYIVYVSDELVNNGTIENNGSVGGDAPGGSDRSGGTGGAGGDGGSLVAGTAGSDGGDGKDIGGGSGTVGDAGTNVNPSLGVDGAAGGNGGSGGGACGSSGLAGGAAGTVTSENLQYLNFGSTTPGSLIVTSTSTATYSGKAIVQGETSGTASTTPSAGSGGGGGGAECNNNGTGGGGGGGTGGQIAIFANTLTNNASGIIQANGGAGGDGGTPQDTDFDGGGGGGGGGSGGTIFLIYKSLTDSGTIQSAGGAGGLQPNRGSDGSRGVDGAIWKINIE